MAEHKLQDLFLMHLKDMYHGEKQILDALPKMVERASNPDLREALEKHRAETADQIDRLEQIFATLQMQPAGESCDAIEGLIKEGEELVQKFKDPEVLDAGLIAAGQAIEHYEIARYGTLCAWADQMDMPDAAALLEQTLTEEKNADASLNELALASVNERADAG